MFIETPEPEAAGADALKHVGVRAGAGKQPVLSREANGLVVVRVEEQTGVVHLEHVQLGEVAVERRFRAARRRSRCTPTPAHRAARTKTMARPKPWAAPVTMTVFPVKVRFMRGPLAWVSRPAHRASRATAASCRARSCGSVRPDGR